MNYVKISIERYDELTKKERQIEESRIEIESTSFLGARYVTGSAKGLDEAVKLFNTENSKLREELTRVNDELKKSEYALKAYKDALMSPVEKTKNWFQKLFNL